MTELRRHGRELLDAARRERTLSPAERERLLRELLASAEQSTSSDTSPSLAHRLSLTGKLLLLAALALGIALALLLAGHAVP